MLRLHVSSHIIQSDTLSAARRAQPDLCVAPPSPETFDRGKIIAIDFIIAGFNINSDELVKVLRMELGLDNPIINLLSPSRILRD